MTDHRTRRATAALATAGFAALAMTQFAPGRAVAAEAAEAAVTSLEPVTVTARKRVENLQDTPIAITALSGQALDERQVTSTEALTQVTPNLVVSHGQTTLGNGSAASYFIRGIGQIDFLLNTDPGVGLYVDGVYVARSIGSLLDLIDLQQVEVLRGPQGTLFGRNTIGGAINVISQPPSNDLRFEARATAASFNRYEGRLVLSGPLSDTLSGKVAILARERDGWVKRITDDSRLGDEREVALRGSLRWKPVERFQADLALDYVNQHGTSPPGNVVQVVETASFASFHNGALVGPPCVPPPGSRTNPACFNDQYVAHNLFEERGTFKSRQELEVFGASLNQAWDISDNLTLRSITGYRRTTALGNQDADHTPIQIIDVTDTYKHRQISEELQLVGKAFDGRLNWIVGAYDFTEKGTNLNFVTFPVISARSGGSVDNRNDALFGQGTFKLTDKLSLTAGLRYTSEDKSFLPDQIILTDPAHQFPPGSVPGFRIVPFVTSKRSITETTPMVDLAYRWNDELMTYATYSEGFKSGGFTQRIFPPLPAPPPFDPEFAKAYETGFKFNSADGRLRLNGAAFYTNYSNLQVAVLVGVQPLTANAASAEVKGFELEVEALPVSDLKLNAALGYTDARYTSLTAIVQGTGLTLDNKFAQVPKLTANVGAGYTLRLPVGELTPRVDVSYRSSTFMNSANTPSLRQAAYALVNAQVTYQPRNAPWRATLFGQNLTNKTYIDGGFADLADQGLAQVFVGKPREWGVTLDYRY